MVPQQKSKPKVVGLYGLSGSGKSTLLGHLRNELDNQLFSLCEGSDWIARDCPSGLAGFKDLDEVDKLEHRQRAIRAIQEECTTKQFTAVVTGHFAFWEGGPGGRMHEVWTSADAEVFTHIIYMSIPAGQIEQQRSDDSVRTDREALSADVIDLWKKAEEESLRQICYQHGISLAFVHDQDSSLPATVSRLVRAFQDQTEEENHNSLMNRLDELMRPHRDGAQTILLMDADKTIAPVDSGRLFWSGNYIGADDPSSLLFHSCGYSYYSFRQMALLYEGYGDEPQFEHRCKAVAKEIVLYPDFRQLLTNGAKDHTLGMIIVTCGLSRVWSIVLEREGLADKVQVIGSGRLNSKFVVTPEAKRNIAARLQDKYHFYVRAFGDSQLDLPMLQQADDAIVVVGHESIRSRSMDHLLERSIIERGLRARQVILPSDAGISPRLDIAKLPVVELAEVAEQEIHLTSQGRLHVVDATDTVCSKLLATSMRDAREFGHGLRSIHSDAGFWLAMTHVGEMIGLEQLDIPHVSGSNTAGYRLRHEGRTTLVACMRGGEAMAFGVSKTFPTARFLHANEASDILLHHLRGQSCVIVVDSVINEGTTIVKFVKRIRQLHRSIRLIVITGVAQVESIRSNGPIAQSLVNRGNLSVIALRISSNKYTGSGGTDTGNRLFNTVYQLKTQPLVLQRSIS